MPYAAGVMVVYPDDNLSKSGIDTYFSEDYSPLLYDSFEKRSTQLLNYFIHRVI